MKFQNICKSKQLRALRVTINGRQPSYRALDRKIKNLLREKHLINTRLTTLSREFNPSSHSRENQRREEQIASCQDTLTKIDDEIKQKKRKLENLKRKEVEYHESLRRCVMSL